MTAPVAPSEVRQLPGVSARIEFIDIGRGIAALLVIYSHIHVVWMRHDHGMSSPVTDALSAAFANPLHLVGQDLGQIGVPFFFLASGFVVTPIALRQGRGRFAVNRFFRVYPLLTVAILLAAGAQLLGLQPLATGQADVITPTTLLTNISLLNYLIFPQVVLLGVAWTLIVEVIFYLLLVALVPVFRRAPWLAIAIQLTAIEVVMMTRGQFGPSWSLFAVNMSLVTLPVIGQVIWAGYARKIPVWLAGLYIAIAWSLFVWAKAIEVGEFDDGYPTAVALAMLLFLLGLFAEPHLRRRRAWTALSERTYSLYLLHGITVFVVLNAVDGVLPLWAGVPLSVAVTFAAAEVTYRFVERPGIALGRRLVRAVGGEGGGSRT